MAEVQIKVEIDGVEYTQEQLKALAQQGEKAAESMENVKKETKETAEEGTLLADFKSRFSDMTSGIKKVVTSFKTLKGAIAATGIGALLLAIGSLISYFKSSEEGSRKLAIATEALSLIFGNLMEFAGQLGEMLVWVFENPKQALMNFVNLIKENIINRFEGLLELLPALGSAISELFSGNFSEAGKIATDAVAKVTLGVEDITDKVSDMADSAVEGFNKMSNAISEAVETATQLVDAQRALRNQQQELIVENAKLNQQLELQQRIAEDTTLTYEERKKALEQVGQAQVALAANVAAQAKAEEDLLKLQIENANTYEEREELETQLAEATAARIEAQTALGITQQEVGKITRELDQEELDRKRSINSILEDLRTANIDNELEAAREELRIAEENALAELEVLRATEEEKQAVRDEYAKLKENLELETQAQINQKLDELAAEAEQREIDRARSALVREEEAAIAEIEALGATEEQKQQLRELYAQKRADLEMTTQEKINEILQAAELEDMEDPFEKAARELEIQEQAQLAQLESLGASEAEKQKIIESFTNKRKDLAEEEAKFKENINKQATQATLDVASSAFGAVADIAGEGSELGKAAAVAQTTIDTYQAATAAYASTVGIPVVGPALAPIAAGVAVAAGIANVNKIINTPVPTASGGSSVGGGGPRPTTSGAATQTFSTNTGSLDLGFNQGIGNSNVIEDLQADVATNEESAPIKTYVVATEVTDAQEANKKIEQIAKL